jgi:replication factor C subunit 2/4
MKLKFKTIPIKDINNKLIEITKMENINIKVDDLKAISEISNGDLRKSILFLQNLKYSKDTELTYDVIYNLNKYISYTQMSNYINKIIENNDISNLLKITNDIINEGYVFYSILKQFIDYVLNLNIDNIKKAKILYNLSNVEKIINNSGDEYSQLLKILNDVRMAFI